MARGTMTEVEARACLERHQMTPEEQRVHELVMEALVLAGTVEDGCDLLRVGMHVWTNIIALWVAHDCAGDLDKIARGVVRQVGLLGEVLEAKLTLRGMLEAQPEMR